MRFADAGTASLAVRGSGAAAVTVGADVVRIANDARESTEWRLIVPRDVERVTVRIGTRAPIVITRADDGADVALDSGRTVRNRLPRDEP